MRHLFSVGDGEKFNKVKFKENTLQVSGVLKDVTGPGVST